MDYVNGIILRGFRNQDLIGIFRLEKEQNRNVVRKCLTYVWSRDKEAKRIIGIELFSPQTAGVRGSFKRCEEQSVWDCGRGNARLYSRTTNSPLGKKRKNQFERLDTTEASRYFNRAIRGSESEHWGLYLSFQLDPEGGSRSERSTSYCGHHLISAPRLGKTEISLTP